MEILILQKQNFSMNQLINFSENKKRVIIQGVLLAGAMALADQSVVLPVIVKYFSKSNVMVGLFTSLLRGGAIIMQLYAAFHARNDALVLPKLKKVFALRFTSWFAIGLIILLLGNTSPTLTLLFFGISLFTFSYSAGFGTIYYQEIMGKMFTKQYRGKLISQRQILAGFVSIIGVIGISGTILERVKAPFSFAFLFLISSLIMGFGYFYFLQFKENPSRKGSSPFNTFSSFIRSAVLFIRTDRQLRVQIITRLFSYGFMLMMPFIILQAKNLYHISGKEIAWMAGVQMAGAMLANFLWGKLSSHGNDKLIVILALLLNLVAYSSLLFLHNYYLYFVVFFLVGASIDGYRLAFSNMLLSRAPENHRPAYVAIYNNVIAIGLFFAIPGGMILDVFGFKILNLVAILFLCMSILFATLLQRDCKPME